MTNNLISNETIICLLRIAKHKIYENQTIAAYKTLEGLLEKMEQQTK